METLNDLLVESRQRSLERRGRSLQSLRGHEAVAEALRRHDADGAALAMDSHIDQIARLLGQDLEQRKGACRPCFRYRRFHVTHRFKPPSSRIVIASIISASTAAAFAPRSTAIRTMPSPSGARCLAARVRNDREPAVWRQQGSLAFAIVQRSPARAFLCRALLPASSPSSIDCSRSSKPRVNRSRTRSRPWRGPPRRHDRVSHSSRTGRCARISIRPIATPRTRS